MVSLPPSPSHLHHLSQHAQPATLKHETEGNIHIELATNGDPMIIY
jgi:hypothetical protein